MRQTITVVGPGGIGKSPIVQGLMKQDVLLLHAYRLRPEERPRDRDDVFYAHPALQEELEELFRDAARDVPVALHETVRWFPESRVFTLSVRNESQLLFARRSGGGLKRMELYAPSLVFIARHPAISDDAFGAVRAVLLNPAGPIAEMENWTALATETEKNCTLRGDAPESVEKRVRSIPEEAWAWRELVVAGIATEYCHWGFAEYTWQHDGDEDAVLAYQKKLLRNARRELLNGNPALSVFLKTEEEIDTLAAPVVSKKR